MWRRVRASLIMFRPGFRRLLAWVIPVIRNLWTLIVSRLSRVLLRLCRLDGVPTDLSIDITLAQDVRVDAFVDVRVAIYDALVIWAGCIVVGLYSVAERLVCYGGLDGLCYNYLWCRS